MFPQTLRHAVKRRGVQRALLGCGIVSSALYVASDIIGTVRYPGYSWLDQEFSELTAQGAPTRYLMIALVEYPYNLLVLAFAAGLWLSAGEKRRAARIAAIMLVGYAAFGFVAGTITPMATREAMEAGADTLRNSFHGPLTLVSDLFLAGAMAFAGQLLGKRFRYYSYATIATLIAFGALAGTQIPQLQTNEPTPWMGLEERVNIYASMIWLVLLATGLLRGHGTEAVGHSVKALLTRRTMHRVPQ
jgi:hypothetical protein